MSQQVAVGVLRDRAAHVQAEAPIDVGRRLRADLRHRQAPQQEEAPARVQRLEPGGDLDPKAGQGKILACPADPVRRGRASGRPRRDEFADFVVDQDPPPVVALGHVAAQPGVGSGQGRGYPHRESGGLSDAFTMIPDFQFDNSRNFDL